MDALHHLLRAKRDQDTHNDDPDFASKCAPAVQGLGKAGASADFLKWLAQFRCRRRDRQLSGIGLDLQGIEPRKEIRVVSLSKGHEDARHSDLVPNCAAVLRQVGCRQQSLQLTRILTLLHQQVSPIVHGRIEACVGQPIVERHSLRHGTRLGEIPGA